MYIDESENFIRTSYKLLKQWFDSKLIFQNLKTDAKNLVIPQDQDEIWIPYLTQGPGAGWGFNELNQEARHHQGGRGHSLDHPPCSDKSQNSGFLRKSIFLILGGPKKLF